MWKTVKLGDVCTITNGSTPLRKEKLYWEEGNVPWFTIDDFRLQGKNITYTQQNVTQAAVDDKKVRLVPANSVLLCCTASIGEAAIARVEMATNQQFNALTPKSAVLNSDYLYFVATTLTQTLLSLSGSTTINFISMGKLKEISIPLPSLAEQERIVAKLDAAFAEIESLNKIASVRKAELAKLKEALLLKTLSSEKSDLINLGDVCELIYGKGLDKIYRLENDGIPAYGANGIKAYSTKILSDEPSIIIGRKGSAGELTRVSSAFWALDVTYYTKINKKLIDLDFLYYTLSSMDLPSMAKGVKPGINRNDVYKRLIYLPTLEEQKHIVSILDAAYIEIEKVNDSVSKLKNNCDALKTAILKEELQSSEAA